MRTFGITNDELHVLINWNLECEEQAVRKRAYLDADEYRKRAEALRAIATNPDT